MPKNADKCKEIPVLHVTPERNIPSILKNGFQHTKDFPGRASWGRGSAEDDLIFFERNTPVGVKFALQWKDNFDTHGRGEKHGIISAKARVCNYLDKRELAANKDEIARKAGEFIIKTLQLPSDQLDWAKKRWGTSLISEFSNPFSYLRKIATDATHVKDGKLVATNIGDVMAYLGYDAADGFASAHTDPEDARFMNELVITNPKLVGDIKETSWAELCDAWKSEPKLTENCKKRGIIP